MRQLRSLPRRALSTDFLIQSALMALDRWDRLDAGEQARFRQLARTARGAAVANLPAPDRRELNALWRRLEARKLLTDIVRGVADSSS